MLKIVFLTLFIFVSNFFEVKIPQVYQGLFKKSNNEYIAIENNVYSSYTYTIKVEYDNVTVFDKKYYSRANYGDDTFDIMVIDNNLIFYGLMFNVSVENNGKTKNIVWRDHFLDMIRFQAQAFSNDCLLICTWTYNFSLINSDRYDLQLHLIKAPYIEISKPLLIETLAKNYRAELIGLKDYFVYIRIDKANDGSGNITYKFVDFDLNLVNSLTYKFENYSEIYFYKLSNSGKVNEFMLCILKKEDISPNLDTYKCQVIKYENNGLSITQTIDIPIIGYRYSLERYFFDGNKIVFYVYDIYNYESDNINIINILQYENQVLSFYKNFKNLSLPKIVEKRTFYAFQVDFTMTEQGLALIFNTDFYYLNSICVPKTITLYANQLLEFPIEELIFPGIDPLQFSFEEVSDFLTIYKNSTEIQKGEIFEDLDNFKYFLKIDTFFNDIKIKVKNHEFDFICNINIEVYIDTNISTYKENKKCFKNNDYDEINNIIYSNLYDYFTVNNKRLIRIELILEKEPKDPELKFTVEDHPIICTKNSTKITCYVPVSILPELKRVHLYSYLSCFNLVDVGWLEINDKDVFNIYSLINYDFDKISEIYDPWEIITEYNPAVINYYYWFSCLSYCDDKKIEQKDCCNNILDKWEIVFHKEYKYEDGLLNNILEKLYEQIENLVKKDTQNPPAIRSDSPNIDSPTSDSPSKSSSAVNQYLSKIINDTDSIDNLNDIVKDLVNLQNSLLNEQSGNIQSYINLNGKSWIPAFDPKQLVLKLTEIIYIYNFVILKNDEYKKIVVTFPGSSTYIQLIDELYYEEMIDLPIADGKQHYYVMKYYYDIFTKIEEDLFNTLEPLTSDPDYQVIFTGHSLGGAIASLASFYYIKKYNFTAENILITFGQPKVGSENFAKELTNIMNDHIYRIARPYDIATLFPIKEIDYLYKAKKIYDLIMDLTKFALEIVNGNYIGAFLDVIDFISNFENFKKENLIFIQHRTTEDYYYSHTGGLYMINDDTNTVYHCDDFYNEKRDHFLCKNHNLELSLTIINEIINDFFQNRNYLTLDQDIMSGCQKRKLKLVRFLRLSSINWENILFTRRLEIINNINHNNINKNNNKGIRKLNNIEDNQTIKLFEEINFDKNKFEFCFKYESREELKNDNLFLIINPKNNYFFGEICLTQNITWLINNEFVKINCYFANSLTQFALKMNLKKEIINEKELYIYVKGKLPGSLELYDLSKKKALNISSSYIFPYINDFPQEKTLEFILPKIKEDIYLNIIIYDYSSNKNITNSSIFELYKGNNKINYENNNIILEKNNEYNFKYYPDLYKLIINFIPIYSNKFLEKQFYIVDEQNIYISYNIESIPNNQSFGLFFDFNEVINIRGYFSKNINQKLNNSNLYILNTYDKYFNLIKSYDRYNYFNLDIKVESQFVSELIIYDIQEVIIINKIDSIYEINKSKNYMFLVDETLKNNYDKLESYTVISINNDNNIIKLISINDDIITSKNYLMTKLNYIKGIFIKTNEDDTFMIKLINEEVSTYLNEESSSNFFNSFIDDKKYSIDFIRTNEQVNIFYNSISTELKIYEINNGSYFQLEEIINNKYNYSLLFGMKSLEEKKTHLILKKSSNPFLYEKYIDNLILDLNYRLYKSKICYLFMDFEYRFSYNIKMNKILMKVLNNDKNETIYFYCNNEIKEIKNDVQILDVKKCNGTFVMLGNNSLLYFYLPLTVADSYVEIRNEDSFNLSEIYHFFLVPKKNEFNSINILLTLDTEDPTYPVFLYYYIDYGIIPYSRNIEKRQIIIQKEANIVIPNYANLSKDDETYFIYFRFNTTLSKLSGKIIYENIIYLADQTYIILKPGINIIKFTRNIDHYLNITKCNKGKNSKASYSIYKDEKVIEQNIINDTDNIIYIEEPIYRENIKLKIENIDEILIRVSPVYFDDFSIISYNKNLDIKQIENILRIKFNTTNYKSRLEYQIALIEKEENIDPLSIHKKFYENNLIYKNIIYSSGKEPIETNISLINNTNNFTYDKDYTLIAYGKDFYGDSINYFYMEPISLFIADPNKSNVNEETNNITNTSKTNNTDITIIDPETTNDIKESTTISESTSTKNNTESTISTTKTNTESTDKAIAESTITKTTPESSTNTESISTSSSAEEKTDKITIEPSITPITSIEETENPKESIPVIIVDNKNDDNSKPNIIAIIFSIIVVIFILGGICWLYNLL